MSAPLVVRAGRLAHAHLRKNGLQPADIAIVAAAAGGPKGLILNALDRWLFGDWLPRAARPRSLIGASIGAWRMAAAVQPDPDAAFVRLATLYCAQHYPPRPAPALVSAHIRALLDAFLDGHAPAMLAHPHHHLHLLAVRGQGGLHAPRTRWQERAGFARATLANVRGRPHLAAHLARVLLGDARDPLPWLAPGFDAFDTQRIALTPANLADALLASGTLPLIMPPVCHLPDAPDGHYWDGGLIDYHLALPYARLQPATTSGQLVLYPHFCSTLVPGWLDKAFPWRRAEQGPLRHWLDNVILLAPSPAFIARLPRGKLPDRGDFQYYGQNHATRRAAWHAAIDTGAALRDAFAAFLEHPDPTCIQPLNF